MLLMMLMLLMLLLLGGCLCMCVRVNATTLEAPVARVAAHCYSIKNMK